MIAPDLKIWFLNWKIATLHSIGAYFPSQLCIGGRYFAKSESERLIGRWPGWRCTTTRSTRSTRTPSTDSPSKWSRPLPPPCFHSSKRIHNISHWIQTIQWEMEHFLLLHWTPMKKLQSLPCSLRITPNSVFTPTRLLFHSSGCSKADNFSGFSAPEFCCNSHFLLLLAPLVQTFRTSNCLLWLLQHLKEKCGPGIPPPIQILSVHVQKWKPSPEESKFQSQRAIGYHMVIFYTIWRNNEQGISYHKNIKMPKWMGVCQKFWGLINPHHLPTLPTCTSLRNRRTVWTYSTII